MDDAPLVVVDYAARSGAHGDVLVLRTSMDDVVEVDAGHPMRFALQFGSDGIKPYVLVRGRIEALLNRSTTMALLNDERFVRFEADDSVLKSGPACFAIKPKATDT